MDGYGHHSKSFNLPITVAAVPAATHLIYLGFGLAQRVYGLMTSLNYILLHRAVF